MEASHVRGGMPEARLLLAARRYEDARRVAYVCSAQNPGDEAPLLLAARAELALGDAAQAERTAAQAVGLAPDNSECHRILARTLISQAMNQRDFGRYQIAARALTSAQEALRLASGHIDALLTVAEAAAWARQFPEATSTIDQAIVMYPTNEHVWFIRSRVARLAGDYLVAEASAREALRIAPDFYGASNELGLILQAIGDRRGARQQFVASAALDPVAKPARTNLLMRNAWWVYLVCLVVTSPLVILAAYVKPPQTGFLSWIVVAVVLRNALLRWTPLTQRLQRRAVTKAGKTSMNLTISRSKPTLNPAAPIRRRYRLRTWLLVVWTAFFMFFAVGVTAITIGDGTNPAAAVVPDLAMLACIVELARRARRRNAKVDPTAEGRSGREPVDS